MFWELEFTQNIGRALEIGRAVGFLSIWILLRGYLPMLVLVSDVLYVILMSPTLKIYNLFFILIDLIYFNLGPRSGRTLA